MICRGLSETKVVTIGDAKFTIGIIPRKNWRNVTTKLSIAANLSEKFQGQDPKVVGSKEGAVEASMSLQDAYADLIRYGLRYHDGLTYTEGTPVPFKITDGIVSEETLEFYDLNNLLITIGSEILAFNTMSGEERKNS